LTDLSQHAALYVVGRPPVDRERGQQARAENLPDVIAFAHGGRQRFARGQFYILGEIAKHEIDGRHRLQQMTAVMKSNAVDGADAVNAGRYAGADRGPAFGSRGAGHRSDRNEIVEARRKSFAREL